MTSVPGPPVQVATQFYPLAAQSTLVEGSVSPEVVRGTAHQGSNRAGWRHCGSANQQDRTTPARSAKPR
jgi:hypothetical protein